MRHSLKPDEGVAQEPNLTSMLDLILQILMFFITTTRLVEKEKNHKVDLPFSQTARPLDRTADRDYLFLTIDYVPDRPVADQHQVHAIGKKFDSYGETRVWLQRKFADKKRDAQGGEVSTRVILRAHKDAELGEILKLFRLCQDVGFKNLQIRAFKEI